MDGCGGGGEEGQPLGGTDTSARAPDLRLQILNLSGDEIAVWEGPADTTVTTVKRSVAEQLSRPDYQVQLVWQRCKLAGDTTLEQQNIMQGGELQLLLQAGKEAQLRTHHYRSGGRHFWGTDPDGRAFHLVKTKDLQEDVYSKTVLTVETWIIRAAINGLEGAFSLESSSKPEHFLFLDPESAHELHPQKSGALLWLVGSERALAAPDAASFIARSAERGNAFNIFACNLPDKAITHTHGRLAATTAIEPHRRDNPDPLEMLTAPFEAELPIDMALQTLSQQ